MNILFDLPPITEKKPVLKKRPAYISQPIIENMAIHPLELAGFSELNMAIEGFVACISDKGFEWKAMKKDIPEQNFKLLCIFSIVDFETGEIIKINTIEETTAKGHQEAEYRLKETYRDNKQVISISIPIIGVFSGYEMIDICKVWVNAAAIL